MSFDYLFPDGKVSKCTSRLCCTCNDVSINDCEGASMAFNFTRLSKAEADEAFAEPDDKQSYYDHKRSGSVKKTTVLCIDGEGKNLKGTELVKRRKHSNWSFSREQVYTYLAASNSDSSFTSEISNFQAGLTTLDCFKWLMNLPADALIVGFAFNYDINMMLEAFRQPKEANRLKLLYEKQSVMWKGYKITYIPHKSFSLSYTNKDGVKSTRTVWDSFSDRKSTRLNS